MNLIWQTKQFAQTLMNAWGEGLGAANFPSPVWYHAPGPKGLHPGPVVFYGIQPDTFPIWLETRIEGRDFYYIDNAYFSPGHGEDNYVRVTKNALQCSGYGKSNLERLKAHDVKIAPESNRLRGPILITCQSGWWYVQHGTCLKHWLDRVIKEIRCHSDRPIKVRLKPKAKYLRPPNTVLPGDDLTDTDAGVPFEEDLKAAWCVVTHSSNTAIEAILAGVPAFVLGESAAAPFAERDLKNIEYPNQDWPLEEELNNWCGVLADNQWTLREIREGKCWTDLCARED